MRLFRIFSMVSCWKFLGQISNRTRYGKMEKKHITHHNLQHLSAHLLQHSTLFPASNLYKFLQPYFSILFATCQVSHRQVCAAVSQCQNRHSQKNGGSCWTRWTHCASSRTPNSTFCRLRKKNAKILTQPIFCPFFFHPFLFPRKSHTVSMTSWIQTLPWHACDGHGGPLSGH